MYLTELVLELHQRANPYDLHRKLWQLYDLPPGNERPFQFRVEQIKGNTARILMQSVIQPLECMHGIRILRSKKFLPAFQPGQYLRFRLKANPIKTIKDEGGRKNSKGETKSCRVPLIDDEQQIEWLSRKLALAASLIEVVVRSREDIYFRKGGHAGKVVTVTFEGKLRIDDHDVFNEILASGIGPAKGFGCGMLSLAPV